MQTAYLGMKSKMGKLKLVSAAIDELEEVVEFHEVYGRFDIIALIEVEDLSELKTFIQNKIMIISGLSYCETFITRD